MPLASAEAKAAFGDGGLYVEKLIERARHIEVQVLGDGRDVDPLLRARMLAAAAPPEGLGGGAVAGARRRQSREALCAVGGGAGEGGRLSRRRHARISSTTTPAGDFYFIEMNTRIQVEHPVTEMVTGIDLVREMLAHRRRRAAPPPPGRHRARAATPSRCASMPRIRRTASCRSRARSAISRIPGGPGVRFDTHALCRLHDPALLRFASRQADRLGRGPRRTPSPPEARARTNSRSAASRPPSRSIRCSPTIRTCAPAHFHTAGWSAGSRRTHRRLK